MKKFCKGIFPDSLEINKSCKGKFPDNPEMDKIWKRIYKHITNWVSSNSSSVNSGEFASF